MGRGFHCPGVSATEDLFVVVVDTSFALLFVIHDFLHFSFLCAGLSARQLGGVFNIEWISRKELSFTKTQHIFNSWNDGKPIKIGRDGQEIEPRE